MFKKVVGLLTIAVAGLFFVGSASAQIVGSSHDLQAEIASLSDVCSICHAPHANESAGTDGLLWNHADSTNLAADYTVYDSGTLQGTVGTPGPVSMLCLSCHDGTVAVDSFGGTTGAAMIGTFTNGGTALGSILSDDHPIGINYDVTDLELNALTANVDFNTSVASTGAVSDLLFTASDLVECGSCHDVHNTQSNGGVAGEALLRVDNTNSALCTTCHAK